MRQLENNSEASLNFVTKSKVRPQFSQSRQVRMSQFALLLAILLFWLPQNQRQALASAPRVIEQIEPGAQGKLAVVGAQKATLYATPGGKVLETLQPGTTLTAYGRTGDSQWVIVKMDKGATGWIMTDQLVIFGMDSLPLIADAPATPATTGTPKATTVATTTSPTMTVTTPAAATKVAVATATEAPPTATPLPTATPMPTATPSPTTPPPTATPLPTATALPTATPTSANATNINSNPIAVVGSDNADLLNAPNGTSTRPLTTGTTLTTKGQSADGNWLYVSTSDNATGWVATSQVVAFGIDNLPVVNAQGGAEVAAQTPVTGTTATTETTTTTTTVAPENAPTSTVATTAPAAVRTTPAANGGPIARVVAESRINIRSGPGTDYRIIAKAQPNETFAALARDESSAWVQIEVSDVAAGFGWVSADLVEVDKAIADLPVSDRVGSPPAPTAVPAPTATPAEVGAQPAAPSVQAATVQTVSNTPAVSNPVVKSTGPTGLNGHLVIESTWGGTIYVYDLASGALRPLTGGFDPEISPDGTQVAFTRDGNDRGVYVINLDGSNEHRVFGERDQLRSPKWSPDGKSIVFSRSEGTYGCYNLGPYCMSSQQILPIPKDAPPAQKEALEAIRSKILKDFDKDRRSNFMIASVSTDGSNFRDIAALDSARAPDWSAGGITYSSPAGIQKTDDKPGAQNSLVTADNNMMDPDWQPGGGRIVFQMKQGSHWEIFGVNPDGSGLAALTRPVTTLVDHLPSNVSPSWSPDGQQIVYLSNRDANNDAGAWRIWVMNADGSNQHPLAIELPLTYNFVAEQMVSWGK